MSDKQESNKGSDRKKNSAQGEDKKHSEALRIWQLFVERIQRSRRTGKIYRPRLSAHLPEGQKEQQSQECADLPTTLYYHFGTYSIACKLKDNDNLGEFIVTRGLNTDVEAVSGDCWRTYAKRRIDSYGKTRHVILRDMAYAYWKSIALATYWNAGGSCHSGLEKDALNLEIDRSKVSFYLLRNRSPDTQRAERS